MPIRYGSVCSGVEAASLAWHQLGWKPMFFAEVEPFPAAVLKERFGASLPSCPLNPEELLDGQGDVLKGKEKEYAERVSWKRTFDKMRRQENANWAIPNFGDMTKIGIRDDGKCFAGDLTASEEIDLLVGGTPCFTKDTLVLTEDGYRPISEIKVGDFVLSDKGRLCRVVKIGHKESAVMKVRLGRGHEFKVTANHPFLVFGDDGLSYVTVAECGDSAVISPTPSNGECRSAGEREDELSKSLGFLRDAESLFRGEELTIRLCGWFLRCGDFSSDKMEIRLRDEATKANFKRLFGKEWSFDWEERGQYSFATLPVESAISAFLRIHFVSDDGLVKKVPSWCYHKEFSSIILNGFSEASPGKNPIYDDSDGRWKPLAYGIADLAECDVEHHENWIEVKLDCPSAKLEIPEVGCLVASPIDFREECGEKETVYNLEVEGDHTYVANGAFVHNCQSYSLAGKREGNRGVSGLSLDYIRLARDPHSKCRWVVWENVPGALSSTNGLDFAAFLSGICGHDVGVPAGGWRNAGICEGRNGGFGVAWRVLDAQYVRTPGFPRAIPQRRRRIFLVGYRSLPVGNPLDWQYAAEVLFDGESLSGNTPPRRRTRETPADYSGKGTAKADFNLERCFGKEIALSIGNGQLHEALAMQTEVMNTLHCMHDVERIAIVGDDDDENCVEGMVYENHANDKRVTGPYDVCPTLTSRMGTGGGNVPLTQVVERCAAFKAGNGSKARSLGYEEEISPTLTSVQSGGNGAPTIVCFTQNQRNEVRLIGGDGQVSGGVMAQPGMKNNNYICELSHDEESVNSNGESVMPAICASEYKGVQNQKDHSGGYVIDKTNEKKKKGLSVRKLMPIETERLMGFPDNHTAIPWNGKSAEECPDAPRYKACGNSMCVNCMEWIGRRIEMVEKQIQEGK